MKSYEMQEIFAFGYNGFQQITPRASVDKSPTESKSAGGNYITVTTPTCMHIDSSLEKNIKKVVIGWSYFIILTDYGEAFCTGSCGLKGNRIHSDEQSPFSSVEKEDVSSVACTWNELWVLFKNEKIKRIFTDGTILAEKQVTESQCDKPSIIKELCGTESCVYSVTEHGCFGMLKTEKGDTEMGQITFNPYSLDFPTKVIEMSCGKEHTLILTEQGIVLSFGSGSRGQLGHSTVEDEEVPRAVEALEGVRMTSIAAGGWHSAATSEVGDVYIWGWNESGQLGLFSEKNNSEQHSSSEGTGIQFQTCPEMVDLGDINVSKAACGSRHTVILTENGDVLSTGWNKYGQLGHGDLKSYFKFEKIKFFTLNKMIVRDIFCGWWNSVVLVRKENG